MLLAATPPCEIMSDPRVHRMRGILRFSPTFTLTLSHGGGGIALTIWTRQERFDAGRRQVHSLEETVLIS
ncbi:unnamed protein product [Lasius platythorax]|uniref:Uncharacterized protein n=1 Tax=Lasius platythorax TaxID=488582 RepID=A0AAV2NMX5_9HYME